MDTTGPAYTGPSFPRGTIVRFTADSNKTAAAKRATYVVDSDEPRFDATTGRWFIGIHVAGNARATRLAWIDELQVAAQ